MVQLPVFLALKKVRVRQHENSDSKPCVGVNTQALLPANTIATLGGLCRPDFFAEKALGDF